MYSLLIRIDRDCAFKNHFIHLRFSLVRYLPKHTADLFHGFVLRLWDFLVYKEREEQLQRGEDDEHVSAYHLLERQKANADDKVCSPVDGDGDGSGGWSGGLIEQLGHQEPWDTSRSGGEQNDEHDDENDREVCCHCRSSLEDANKRLIKH